MVRRKSNAEIKSVVARARWQPEDDLKLITAIEQTNDMSTVHSAITFSCYFTTDELVSRWNELLFNKGFNSSLSGGLTQKFRSFHGLPARNKPATLWSTSPHCSWSCTILRRRNAKSTSGRRSKAAKRKNLWENFGRRPWEIIENFSLFANAALPLHSVADSTQVQIARRTRGISRFWLKKRAKIESVWVRVSITHTGPSSQGDFLTHVFSLLYFLCVYVLALVFMAVKVWRGSRPTREAKTPWESLLSVGVLQVPHPAHSEHHQDVACVRIDDRELIVSIFNFALLTRKILDWSRTRSSRSMEPKEDFETRVTDSSTTKLFGWRLKSVRRFGGRLHKLWNFEHSWYNYNRPRRKCRPRS